VEARRSVGLWGVVRAATVLVEVGEDPLAGDRWLAGVEGVGVAGQLGFDLGARVRA
jgi:hypothetical protein